jgi:chemotaxis receptor (MCP) glutamine deamidase CheD
VVEKHLKDYSFSEIAQIVEGNNTRLLGAFITTIENETAQITLKIGDANINEVLQTFRRYHYSIISGSTEDKFLEELRQRSDYLDKYLNV